MRKVLLLALWGLSLCVYSQNKGDTKMNQFIDNLMQQMTFEEKVGQLNLAASPALMTGTTFTENINEKLTKSQLGAFLNVISPEEQKKAQEIVTTQTRMKIPLLFGLDVIHGYKTIFPIPLALACTWDPALIEKTARRAIVEATSTGINWVYSPMVDISRDPRWGRVAEGAGEDPYLGGLVAKAMIRGIQGDDLSADNTAMACVKHFALYGASEGGKDYNTVDMSRVQMFNYYMEPYKAAVEAGTGSLMTSFNLVEGIPATGNKWLLTDVLRKQWGFDGFIVTDFTSLNEMIDHGMGDLETVTGLALNAGVDMDMAGEAFLTKLAGLVKKGVVKQADIDAACRRVLEAKYKLGLFEDPFRYLKRVGEPLVTPESRALAREAARQSTVLLKNANQTLPLQKKGKIALVGPLMDSQYDMMGTWALTADKKYSITLKEGIKNAVGDNATVVYAKGANIVDDEFIFDKSNFYGFPFVSKDPKSPEELLKEAIEVAKQSDVVVVALGEGNSQSGESASRTNIDLFENQKTLLKELVKTGKPVVLVLFNGRPLTLTWEDENCAAIVEAWAPGSEAGNAVADILFGDYNPSGKITMTFPRSVGQIPIYYNHMNTGRPYVEGGPHKFKANYIDEVNDPLYPFGYGLSYTTFEYGDVKLNSNKMNENGSVEASVTVSNTGNKDGNEIVQLYIRDEAASISRPVKELKGFEKIFLKAGETKTVKFTITADQLKFYNNNIDYVCEPGMFEVMIGKNSQDVKSSKFELVK